MPQSVRSYFEPRFGHGFANVRLHTDSRAAQLAGAVDARAFTVGQDVVFGAGQYDPSSVEGRTLIAHELAHVLQPGSEHPVIRRKIKFAPQPPVREDPIDKILRGEPAVGLTTPTVNGSQPTDFQDAEKRLNNALMPKQTSYDAKTSECTINDFDVSISANVRIFTEPKDGKWRKYVPGSSLRNAAACKDLENVPVVMKGTPSSDSVEKLVAANEQEHVDDLKRLYGQHLEPHFRELASLKGKGDSSKTCSDDIRATAGSKRAVAITDFLQAWHDSVTNRDEGGKHTLKTKTTVKDKCVRVEIEAEKR
jgi:hypothetical protein